MARTDRSDFRSLFPCIRDGARAFLRNALEVEVGTPMGSDPMETLCISKMEGGVWIWWLLCGVSEPSHAMVASLSARNFQTGGLAGKICNVYAQGGALTI